MLTSFFQIDFLNSTSHLLTYYMMLFLVMSDLPMSLTEVVFDCPVKQLVDRLSCLAV